MARVQLDELLKLLARRDVDFIVVGMTAGILQGVFLTTKDVDIVHRRTPENVLPYLEATLDEISRGNQ